VISCSWLFLVVLVVDALLFLEARRRRDIVDCYLAGAGFAAAFLGLCQ
jgi:hypothetical protein